MDWLLKLKAAREKEAKAPKESEKAQALKAKLEKARAIKEKSTAIKVRKEYDELKDTNMAAAEALERETKMARKEELSVNKFRGALWGSNSELKLRRDERDQSWVEGMILKDELKA